jgi:prefoldin subunit 5
MMGDYIYFGVPRRLVPAVIRAMADEVRESMNVIEKTSEAARLSRSIEALNASADTIREQLAHVLECQRIIEELQKQHTHAGSEEVPS